MPKRVIFDTDIGTDVDDCLALALLLASPEVQLEGVTCVYGDVELRARMVQKLLHLRGHYDVPLYLGARTTLLGLRKIFWPGHEGVGLLAGDDPPLVAQAGHAADYIVETVLANPGEIHLLAVGPLTNVALALRKEPRIAGALASLVIMGGAVRGPGRFHLPLAEHNIVCDPEAAHVVLASGAPITLVPLDVTTQVRIWPAGVERIKAAGTPFHLAVADQVTRYPGFAKRGWTHLHDPLAAALLCDPSLVTFEPLVVHVETGGRLAAGATLVQAPTDEMPATAQVALSVDAARFEEWYVARVAGNENA
jgi:purine nucleosidase